MMKGCGVCGNGSNGSNGKEKRTTPVTNISVAKKDREKKKQEPQLAGFNIWALLIFAGVVWSIFNFQPDKK